MEDKGYDVRRLGSPEEQSDCTLSVGRENRRADDSGADPDPVALGLMSTGVIVIAGLVFVISFGSGLDNPLDDRYWLKPVIPLAAIGMVGWARILRLVGKGLSHGAVLALVSITLWSALCTRNSSSYLMGAVDRRTGTVIPKQLDVAARIFSGCALGCVVSSIGLGIHYYVRRGRKERQ